jgi:hypothetical protein
MEIVTLVLAILGALAWLPYIIELITKWLTKPEIKLISGKALELGYTIHGPIINLFLAFSGEKKDSLINKINLLLVHDNKETHEFSWEWFEEELLQMQIPKTGNVPYKKNQQAIAIKVIKDNLIEKKIGFQIDLFKKERDKLVTALSEVSENYQKDKIEEKNIKTQRDYIELTNLNKNSFVWKVGKYNVSIKTYIAEREEPFVYYFTFKISPYDLKQLEKNIDLINIIYESYFVTHNNEFEENWKWVNVTKE